MKVEHCLELCVDLLSYLRAHSLLAYQGKDFIKIKMTEPVVLDYETMILEQYLEFLKLLQQDRFSDITLDDDLHALRHICPTWRYKFIVLFMSV